MHAGVRSSSELISYIQQLLASPTKQHDCYCHFYTNVDASPSHSFEPTRILSPHYIPKNQTPTSRQSPAAIHIFRRAFAASQNHRSSISTSTMAPIKPHPNSLALYNRRLHDSVGRRRYDDDMSSLINCTQSSTFIEQENKALRQTNVSLQQQIDELRGSNITVNKETKLITKQNEKLLSTLR